MLLANTTPPRLPPPPEVDATDPGQVDAAAEAMRLHTLLPQPDSVDPDAAIYAILLLVANNGYQAQVSLRDGHPEGPARAAALADEMLSMAFSISGDSMGMQRRLRGAIEASTAPGEVANLEFLIGNEPMSVAGVKSLVPLATQRQRLLDFVEQVLAVRVPGFGDDLGV